MRSHHDKTWALVPADVAEWMGMWEAVPLPEPGVAPASAPASAPAPAPAVPGHRSWRDRLHLTGLLAR